MTLVPLVLVGGGGHASDVLAAIEAVNRARPTYHVVGILDDHDVDPPVSGPGGVTNIAPVEEVGGVDAAYVLWLGCPGAPQALAERSGEGGEPAPPIVHPMTDVGVGVEL